MTDSSTSTALLETASHSVQNTCVTKQHSDSQSDNADFTTNDATTVNARAKLSPTSKLSATKSPYTNALIIPSLPKPRFLKEHEQPRALASIQRITSKTKKERKFEQSQKLNNNQAAISSSPKYNNETDEKSSFFPSIQDKSLNSALDEEINELEAKIAHLEILKGKRYSNKTNNDINNPKYITNTNSDSNSLTQTLTSEQKKEAELLRRKLVNERLEFVHQRERIKRQQELEIERKEKEKKEQMRTEESERRKVLVKESKLRYMREIQKEKEMIKQIELELEQKQKEKKEKIDAILNVHYKKQNANSLTNEEKLQMKNEKRRLSNTQNENNNNQISNPNNQHDSSNLMTFITQQNDET